MSWLNITRNIGDYGEEAIGWFATNNDLWAITVSGSAAPSGSTFPGGTAAARLRRKSPADGSSQGWHASYVGLPIADYYHITGYAADTEYDRLYIANNATGEVFYNITGDPQDDWDRILNKTYGEFYGVAGNIRDLIYYNKQVYLAHKGGVSVMNPATRTWTLVGDFSTGFDGVGQCNNFTVFSNELYVSVSFGDLGAVFKYNTDTFSLQWEKYAELATGATTPQYLSIRDTVLFCTNSDEGQNLFNSIGIDETLTGQPRFTRSKHLDGVPSSMLTHSADGYLYVACWNANFTSISDAHTDNLITDVRQLVPYSAEAGETFIIDVEGKALNDYTTHSSRFGGDLFRGTHINPELTIAFSIQTNALSFFTNEVYTIVWEYGYQCSAVAMSPRLGRLSATGSGPLKVGFASNVGTGIDANSPKAQYINNNGDLFGVGTNDVNVRRHTFTFNADNLAETTNGEFRIEGVVKATIKGALRFETWSMIANAMLRNFKVYRGNAELANSIFVDASYIVKEYSAVSPLEKGNHSIDEPSPPDQWFVKFPITTEILIPGGSDDNRPPTVGTPPGGGGGLDWPPTKPPFPPPPPSLPPPDDPPPSPPSPPGGEDQDNPDPPPPPPVQPDVPPPIPIPPPPNPPNPDDNDEDEGDIVIPDDATEGYAVKLSRLLCTNRMNLVPDEIYKFHVIVNRIKNPDEEYPLHIRISPSKATIKPAYDGVITATGTQSTIAWEFSTDGFTEEELTGIRFRIDLYEKELDYSAGATVYVSDWNILGKIRELPVNTIYRYDGEFWERDITEVSNDGGIIAADGYPNRLVESFEVNSDAVRLYCISSGDIYVWGIGAQDPYGGSAASRIVMSW